MNLYSLVAFALILSSCSSSQDSVDPTHNLANPVTVEYSDKNNLSDYAFFKASIQEFSARSFQRARRWALLKDGPHVLSFLSSDLIEGTRPLASPLGPDPSFIDWMPWWMDLLKIEVSTLLLSKESDLKAVSKDSCIKIYQQRLTERLQKNFPPLDPKEAQSVLSQINLKEQLNMDTLWKLSSATKSSEKQLHAWQRAIGLEPSDKQKVREYYYSRNGIRRRILSLQNSEQTTLSIEIPQDPYKASAFFSKSNQKNVCERINLGLSFAKLKTQPFICSDLEGLELAKFDPYFLYAFTKIAEVPDMALGALYQYRCQELADFHAEQWNRFDTEKLVRRLKLYPQIEKRLRYFAAMESKALLLIAAKFRSKNN